jgi:hypothetical protein
MMVTKLKNRIIYLFFHYLNIKAMRNLLILMFMSLFLKATYGQTVVVANMNMNVFYIGIDNPISVAASGLAPENAELKGSGGGISIVETGAGKYIVKVTTVGESVLQLKDRKTGKVCVEQKFRVLNIPDPIVKVGGRLTTSRISSGEMKAQLGLTATAPNFNLDMKFDIRSYTFAHTSKGETRTYQGKTARFSKEIMEAVAKVRPGDTYTISDIKVKNPATGADCVVNTIVLDIK